MNAHAHACGSTCVRVDTCMRVAAAAAPTHAAATSGFVAASSLLPSQAAGSAAAATAGSAAAALLTPPRADALVPDSLSAEQRRRIEENRLVALERRRLHLADGASPAGPAAKKARTQTATAPSSSTTSPDSAIVELDPSFKRREVCHMLHFFLCQLRAQCQRVLGQQYAIEFDEQMARIDPRRADDVLAQSGLMAQFFSGPAKGDKVRLMHATLRASCSHGELTRLRVPVCRSGCRGTRFWAHTRYTCRSACTRTSTSRAAIASC